MLIAVLSDIHGNLEALNAVLKKCEKLSVDRYASLGDMVGYGPNPVEVLNKSVKLFHVLVQGNHDAALINEPKYFNRVSREAIFWSRKQFADSRYASLLDLTRRLNPLVRKGELVFTHGCYESNMNYVETAKDVDYIFQRLDQDHASVCFSGHSHVPALWLRHSGKSRAMEATYNAPCPIPSAADRLWVNAGSVGQPRDGDPRACFVTYDTLKRIVTFHRVTYDILKTSDKIRLIPELDPYLAERISVGT